MELFTYYKKGKCIVRVVITILMNDTIAFERSNGIYPMLFYV